MELVPPLYPVSLVMADRPCLVVGGGPVAVRKVEGLVACRARVTVVAPEVDDRMDALGDELVIERRPYRAGEVARYRLVITATGVPSVDAAVSRDAEAAGVWVNSADDPAHCSVLLPSVHRDGPVTVAVSTRGTSPALAIWLRGRVASALGADVATLAHLLDDARRRMHDVGRSTESVDWQAVLDGDLPSLVSAGRISEARALLDALTAERP